MAQAKNPLFDTATVLGKIVAFLGISAICGVLVAGLLVPAAAVTGSAASGSMQFFEDMPGELTVNPPGQATRVLAADGSEIATLFSENRTRVALKDISPFVKDGVVSIEDSRYYEHGGVDPTGIARALVATARGSRQGASTITQQYVNNVLNESLVSEGRGDEVTLNGSASKTVGVKLREMKLAIALEKKMSKDQILEGYLNIVFFNANAYGIEAASRYFFSTSAKDLTLPQAAVLAGLVNNPSAYNPITNPEASKMRRDLVLDAMLKNGKITKQQHDEAVKTPVTTKVTIPHQGCQYSKTAPYFCDYVQHLILNDPAYGETEQDRLNLLTRGGLTIKTTLDPRLQKPAQEQADATVGASNPDKWGASLITVQPGTGKILSMAQNSRKVDNQGSQSVTDYNYNVDRIDANGNQLGGLGGFQPGSTMKPITLAAWLNEGKRTDEYVDASRRVYPADFPWKTTCTPVTGFYDPAVEGSEALQNSEGNEYRPMTVREGITLSINTATFASAAGLNDFCDIQRMTDALQVHTTGGDVKKPEKLKMNVLGNILGGTEVAPLTMASAYATFANNGTFCEAIAIDSVTDAQGKKYPGQSSSCHEAIKPDVAKTVTNVLQDVMSKGSGVLIPEKLGVPNAGKTGTNNTNSQTWVIAYTKGLVTASYFGQVFGNPNLFEGTNVTVNGVTYPRIDGAYVAGPQMGKYMQQVVGLYDHGEFDPAPDNLLGTSYVAPPPVQTQQPSNGGNNDKKSDAPTPSNSPSSGSNNGGSTGGNTGGNNGGGNNGNNKKKP
ncbi:transglycosylase domain-containing protein [Arthrobacter sp. NPDC090010]|uniref:transglycosylase domain-containing protein n=1 Tax=Arthrobacter sp. NPDC090010 TaxID=3363942 RepID=UPI003816E2CF